MKMVHAGRIKLEGDITVAQLNRLLALSKPESDTFQAMTKELVDIIKQESTGSVDEKALRLVLATLTRGMVWPNESQATSEEASRFYRKDKPLGAISKQPAETWQELNLRRINAISEFSASLSGNQDMANKWTALFTEFLDRVIQQAARPASKAEGKHAITVRELNAMLGYDPKQEVANQLDSLQGTVTTGMKAAFGDFCGRKLRVIFTSNGKLPETWDVFDANAKAVVAAADAQLQATEAAHPMPKPITASAISGVLGVTIARMKQQAKDLPPRGAMLH